MSSSLDLPGNALVAMTRDSLLALRMVLFRDVGAEAATLLQEAGVAGGSGLFDTLGCASEWYTEAGCCSA